MSREDELKKEIDKLRGKANSWDRIEKFFKENKDIAPYYNEAVEECRRDNCFGCATMMIIAMEKVLEKVSDLEDDVEYLEKELKKKTAN